MKKIRLLAVVFIIAFLIGCDSQFKMIVDSPEIQSGMGVFKLYLDNAQNRTIVPDTARTNTAGYSLDFKNPTSGVSAHYEYVEKDEFDTDFDFIILPAGNYVLTVIAYSEYVSQINNKPIAQGELTNISINEGQAVSGTVNLKYFGVVNPQLQGTFKWDIGFDSNLETATMDITPISTGASAAAQVNLKTDGSGSRALNSGYYRIIITLEKANITPVKWRETLHVYQNMESYYEYDFSGFDFSVKIHTVTFNYNDGTAPVEVDRLHGATITEDVPERSGYIFRGWYTDIAFNNAYNFGNPITSSFSLFAKWEQVITSAAITLTAPVIGAAPVTSAPAAGTGYTCSTITWTPTVSVFADATQYTAAVTLTAQTGYVFTSSTTAAINGNTANIVIAGDGRSAEVSYQFPATESRVVTGITVSTPPTASLTYTHGQTLNLAGLEFSLSWNSAPLMTTVTLAQISTNGINLNLANGTSLVHTTHNGYTITATHTSGNSVNVGTLTVNKANSTFGTHAAINTTYTTTLTLANLSLSAGYAWVTPGTSLNADPGQSFPATYTQSENHNPATGNITVNVAKAAGVSAGTPLPSLNYATHDRLVINTTTAAYANGQVREYGYSTAANTAPSSWTAVTGATLTFTGLNHSTQYYVFVRAAENTNFNAGARSTGVAMSTTAMPVFTINIESVAGDNVWSWGAGTQLTPNGELEVSYSSTSPTTITLGGSGLTNPEWYIKGARVSTTNTLSLLASDYFHVLDIGTVQTLSVEVFINGVPYGFSAWIKVMP